MVATTDTVARNEWVPCGWLGQIAIGTNLDTMIFGQPIRVARIAQDDYRVVELSDAGTEGRSLPVQTRYNCIFTTLGEPTRALPEISEFDEPDRRIVGCGSVGVSTCPYRLIENFLDLAHLCFIHKDILGDPEKSEVLAYKTEHRKDADEIWAVDCSFYQPAASKASTSGQMTKYIYRVMSPFSVMLYKTVNSDPSRNDAICVFIQPIGETQCLAYMPMALVDDVSTDGDIIEFQQSIFLQDRVILENQRPALLPLDPTYELPTRADASSIAYRRWLKAMNIQFGILEKQAA
ncbi:phenylpropionate dioxygenase-like ring-hydroxylating dioxygenase large terminal subunit [Pseudaminobacter salicylatoxidans]|uniref:Phenylpropionate dioxygenase-like ring-hydroxylating dioxygenase large terminal subunit n=1 Tax=Pseudaminobacter salicylatoxidans TaxID=93369 RepID=A0A316C8T2_PSESE|nr:aromatic ring-hydroxylating dioxygenase subunit alpha [Pseudaminobacter salicylatoxidans]PWJ86205.1 phenylpropionate dioxygenase-like ring-hydroxylating dioxygenase large terminal subunit [Pseudaminobacter salicylatoxidans]